ncbi:MAG: hypothetical protein ABR970_19550, partial [Roseiarcus sp.]
MATSASVRFVIEPFDHSGDESNVRIGWRSVNSSQIARRLKRPKGRNLDQDAAPPGSEGLTIPELSRPTLTGGRAAARRDVPAALLDQADFFLSSSTS